jgi:hypothetical protein
MKKHRTPRRDSKGRFVKRGSAPRKTTHKRRRRR